MSVKRRYFIDWLPDENGQRSHKADRDRVYYDTFREAQAVITENGWEKLAAVEASDV